MQDEERAEILNWCKETFGYTRREYFGYSTEYNKRNFSLQAHYKEDLSDFSRQLFTSYRCTRYFIFYPFNNFTFPKTINSTEELFLKSYAGQYVKIISVDLDYNYIYLHEVKVKYKNDLDYLIGIVEKSKDSLKYFTKITLEDVQKYEEENRKKAWGKMQQATKDKIKNNRSKIFYNFFSILSLILFILALLVINWLN